MSNKSFTLIELLVVIVIIALLSGFVAIQVNNSINAGKDAKRKADIKILANAVISYSSENYSNKPVSLVSCTINGDCPSEINSALSPFLENLPSDPDSGQYYTYESDGTDCNISAILSTGQTYRYSCSSDSASIVSPINGTCGTSSGLAFYTQPSTELCSDDSTPSVSGTGPWTWNCPGQYQGVSASCFASKKEDGVCGASDGDTLDSVPTSDLCSVGTASSISGDGPWTWSCSGIYEGVSASCSAYREQDGICGSSNGVTLDSVPTSDLCSIGTASSVSGSGPWTWICSGIYGGDNSGTCMAYVNHFAAGALWINNNYGQIYNSSGTAIITDAGSNIYAYSGGPYTSYSGVNGTSQQQIMGSGGQWVITRSCCELYECQWSMPCTATATYVPKYSSSDVSSCNNAGGLFLIGNASTPDICVYSGGPYYYAGWTYAGAIYANGQFVYDYVPTYVAAFATSSHWVITENTYCDNLYYGNYGVCSKATYQP